MSTLTPPQWDERLSQLIDVRQVGPCEFQSVSEVCRKFLILDALDPRIWSFGVWGHVDRAEYGSRI